MPLLDWCRGKGHLSVKLARSRRIAWSLDRGCLGNWNWMAGTEALALLVPERPPGLPESLQMRVENDCQPATWSTCESFDRRLKSMPDRLRLHQRAWRSEPW